MITCSLQVLPFGEDLGGAIVHRSSLYNMPLFQQSVQKKFIAELDKVKVENAYQKLIAHFSNPTIQENIRNAKEEEYQEGFVRDLFVNVLGYVLNPQPNFNFVLEKKNEKNSKKADGAIIRYNGIDPVAQQVVAVVELKSIKTVDLQSIEIQAFGYKNNQSDCVYIITSNFQKIRFYIENAIEFEEFDLFDISKERFTLLYLCLQADSILSDLPLRVKKLSLEKEESITNKLYADYSLFKKVLYDDLAKHNKEIDRFVLFKKTQKLLDRFLFIFFAEDKGLLPPNSVAEILNQWDKLNDMDASQPLYNRFKLYFGYLNNGHKGKFFDIFAYNGGLFAPDALLDSLTITDNILYNHCRVLAHYDYDTDVDTNILGHIFEHSLNEIDEVAAKSGGEKLDKNKTKRKKDGIFYTPPYITKNMVDSTIGELCKNKKIELGIDNEALIKADTKKDRKILQEKIANYRHWLLHITILDPACGSGAFLNQALVFLIEEHRQIDSMVAMLFGDSLVMTDNITEILENNIFGVDINEESIEIARLSLWLRTAKVGRKLNDLSRNIKIGNSLISDKTIAGDLAFDWKTAFPQVFKNGGFDVILGNPPYVRVQQLVSKDVDFYFENYKTPAGKLDISILFFEKSLSLIKDNGVISFISSSQWMQTDYGKNIREMLSKGYIKSIIDFGSLPVFENVETYPAIFTMTKELNSTVEYKLAIEKSDLDTQKITALPSNYINIDKLTEKAWQFGNLNLFEIIKLRNIQYQKISQIGNSYIGDLTGMDKAFVVTNAVIETNKLEKEIIFPYAYRGEEVNKFAIVNPNAWVIYPYDEGLDGKSVLITNLEEKYPHVYSYLLQYKSELLLRMDSRKPYAFEDNWYRHLRQGSFKYIRPNKLIVKGIDTKLTVGFLNSNSVFNGANCPAIIIQDKNFDEKYLLAILNSKVISYYLNSICPKKLGGYYRYNATNLAEIPIVDISSKEQKPFIDLTNNIINFSIEFEKQKNSFIKLLQNNFSEISANRAIDNWYELSFKDLLKELQKQKVVIGLKDQIEWQDTFDSQKEKVTAINTILKDTTKAINKSIYNLYELTPEEIQIIENQ